MDLYHHGPNGEVQVRTIDYASIRACPHTIMLPEHYREDGTCRCNDPDHTEMAEWGYKWKDGQWK